MKAKNISGAASAMKKPAPATPSVMARPYSWDSEPDGGHPGTEPNCRCWAESIPKEKPDCDEQVEKVSEALDKLQKTLDSLEAITFEINVLKKEVNEIISEIQRLLGGTLASSIISSLPLPVEELAVLILRFFGIKISTGLLESANARAETLNAIKSRVENLQVEKKNIEKNVLQADRDYIASVERLEICLRS